MTERIDRIEAITESNARAIAAYAEAQVEFANRFDAFIQRMDQQGLQVTLIRDVTDDQAGELADAQERTEDNAVRIDALRADAIADRQAFRAALEEDRQRSDQRFEAMQERIEAIQKNIDAKQENIEAMQENIQQLFRELIRTNHRVDGLERAG